MSDASPLVIPSSALPTEQLKSLQKILSTPEPLRHSGSEAAGILTTDGVFSATNSQRQGNGLPPLLRNNALNKAAQLKLEDMFNQQYFEHISPDGRGPSDVVEAAKYEYITVGENLALGNFSSDEALVQAWMDSPGHRANILSNNFRELGIAVEKGEFEGRTTWLAVQTFGTPLSACPSPDSSFLQNFENKEFLIRQIEQELSDLDTQITEQTIIVEDLIEETKFLAKEGNSKIKKGNENIEKGNNIYQETGSREQAQPYWDEGERLHAEGNVLLQEAEEKQTEAQTANDQLNSLKQQYNELIKQYGMSDSGTQAAAEKYNQQVRTFNECINQFE
ncbi:MAG: CAP domain-containing protein [Candidatus Andersenbacteria bacterium]